MLAVLLVLLLRMVPLCRYDLAAAVAAGADSGRRPLAVLSAVCQGGCGPEETYLRTNSAGRSSIAILLLKSQQSIHQAFHKDDFCW